MYDYNDVKQAYTAIIEVGKKRVGLFGSVGAQIQHKKNLMTLEGNAKELYIKLLEDKEINYQQ